MNCAWTARRAATGERMSGLVIRDANLLDCTGTGLQGDIDVEVRDGIISKVGPAGRGRSSSKRSISARAKPSSPPPAPTPNCSVWRTASARWRKAKRPI